MGRPKEHDDATREALRAAAERLFDERGADGVVVRALADEVGTTTRAIYSLFGSIDGLIVDALGARAYELLEAELDDHPETSDAVADVIDMGVSVFRTFVRTHPALFRIAFQRAVPGFSPGPELLEARASALRALTAKIQRLATAGLLADKPVQQAVLEFQALCEGLGNLELRGTTMPMLPADSKAARDAWRAAFTSLVHGMTTRPPTIGRMPHSRSRRADLGLELPE